MTYLNRDSILASSDIVTEDVEVRAWGGKVRVRGMTGDERDAFEESLMEGKGRTRQMRLASVRAKVVAACVVDEKGERLFSDADVKELGRKSAAGLAAVYNVAARLSGISDDDTEELAADFSKAGGGASSSASPAS